MLAGSILGAWRGALAMVLFLTLVAAGLPLLSGGRGGLGVFVGPSAGFLVGYVAGAYVTGLVAYEAWRAASWPRFLLANVLGGIVVVYAIGIPVLAQIAKLSLLQALTGSLIFIPGDLLKAILAASAAMFVRRGNPSLMTARPSYEG
jgi:biotin transport system substrate-specific component